MTAFRPTSLPGALLTALLAAVLVLFPLALPASAQDRTITYTISAQGSVQGDLGRFAAVAEDTLNDPRGWALGGTVAFRQVSSGSDFDLILASPAVVGNAAPGCSAQWSCRVGRNVYINDARWRTATQSWTHSLAQYQHYVILHEVGHWIGLGHRDCPVPGRTAPVMQQQSIGLQGCRANVWPVIAERSAAGSELGVRVAWTSIENKYRSLGQENGFLGVPITWERPTPGTEGAYQHFRASGVGGGSIYWTPRTGSHEVRGSIRSRWADLGWEVYFGFPTTDERTTPDGVGRYNHFTAPDLGGGSIYWTPRTGAREVFGSIRTHWAELGWEVFFGYPTTGERTTPDGVGRYNHFTAPDLGGGSIYWTPETGAHEVFGSIRSRWASEGWETGPLGYPTSGEYAVDGGRRNDFQGGYIFWNSSTGATEVVLAD